MIHKRRRIPLDQVLRREMEDEEFAFYFERERVISAIARAVRDARLNARLTQAEVAKRAKTSQGVIARLESGNDRRIPSLDLLGRIAKALKARLRVSFQKQKAA